MESLLCRVDAEMKFGINIDYVKSHSPRLRQYIDFI